jgi:hypothetical protein
MSQANAAAIKRRVNAPQLQQQNGRQGLAQAQQGLGQAQQQNQRMGQVQQGLAQGQAQPSGLTLQQVIAVIDKRLVNVELGLNEIKSNKTQTVFSQPEQQSTIDDDAFTSMVSEFNDRFELIAMEINNLKDVVIKLQSYTMEVNRTLLEERINILSDLGATEPINVDHESIVEHDVDPENNVETNAENDVYNINEDQNILQLADSMYN